MNLVLGAGLAGLSVSWHLGHRNCLLLEKSHAIGGHARSVHDGGFTLDHGPHVSFTRHGYVRDLFAANVDGEVVEHAIRTANFFRGDLVDHPAQVHLWQLPADVRERCAASLRQAAASGRSVAAEPASYREWLHAAYGPAFSSLFPEAYTRKYWTVDAGSLSADWVGPRMHVPSLGEIEKSLIPGTSSSAHYITKARYPLHGGYEAFFSPMADGAEIRTASEVRAIQLRTRDVTLADGTRLAYDRLISTIPLPQFVNLCVDAPSTVREAAAALDCSKVLLVDVFSPVRRREGYAWYYVYDEHLLSTRIHAVEGLSPHNAPWGHTGIQVEVYFSRYRDLSDSSAFVGERVADELESLGFLRPEDRGSPEFRIRTRWCPYANVMFTHSRRSALDQIWRWLEEHGLAREDDDLNPVTDWANARLSSAGSLVMAGRFAQWKYFWTDDCVLRGRQVAQAIDGRPVTSESPGR